MGRLNLKQLSVAKDDSFESESLLQFFDNGPSLELLDETHNGVEEQKSTDDTEIDPILKSSG